MTKTSSKIFLKLHPALKKIIPGIDASNKYTFKWVVEFYKPSISKHCEYSINTIKCQLN